MKPQGGLTVPKPKEHGAWGMLYVPLVTAAGIAGTFNVRVLLVAAAITFVFLSQRPFAQLLSSPVVRRDPDLLRRNLTWLAGYWVTALVLFSWLYYVYDLIALPRFVWIAIPIAATFTLLLWKNRVRSVAGELIGICGLTLTAPLTHYAAVGEFHLLGFWLWVLCILYFSSSVFFVKAVVSSFLKSRSKATAVPTVTARVCVFYHGGLVLLLASLLFLNQIPTLAMVAFTPVIVRGLWGIPTGQPKLNFARIGWTEVIYSLFFAIVTILAMRLETFAR
ncbi:MAG TPA: YwiC-like family protein [Terriglobia bacterium]|nr:YwiC-like family protein [Terriglobia bacterium]